MPTDTDKLVRSSRRGDREAFGELYDLHAKRIYAYLYYRCFNRETAEDLTATVFLKALEGLDLYKPGLGGFAPWIYGIARNALADHFRTAFRSSSLDDVRSGIWDLADSVDFTLDVERHDLWERTEPHLRLLAPEQREVVMLRVWDDLPYRDIAAILGRTEGSCKMAFSRALALLREAMPLSLLLAFLALKPPIA